MVVLGKRLVEDDSGRTFLDKRKTLVIHLFLVCWEKIEFGIERHKCTLCLKVFLLEYSDVSNITLLLPGIERLRRMQG
jgi:hypothetical protein